MLRVSSPIWHLDDNAAVWARPSPASFSTLQQRMLAGIDAHVAARQQARLAVNALALFGAPLRLRQIERRQHGGVQPRLAVDAIDDV